MHRLSDQGVVVSHTAQGISFEGVEAEWRMISMLTVAGDQINRVEIFDETELDAALARFDNLHPQERRLENTATRVSHSYADAFASQDWNAVSEQVGR